MVIFQVKYIKTASDEQLGSSLEFLERGLFELSLKGRIELYSLARRVHNVKFYEVFLVKATVRNASLHISERDSIDLTEDLRATADATSEARYRNFAKICRNVVKRADIVFVVYLRTRENCWNWRRWLSGLTWRY